MRGYRFKVIGEIFALDRTAWWRRNVITVTRSLLRFSIHGTLFRSVRKGLAYILAPKQLQWVLEWVKDLLWPGGQLFEASPDRTEEEKQHNQAEVRGPPRRRCCDVRLPHTCLCTDSAPHD